MSKLKNERHERFALALAMGRGGEEAFRMAGYRERGKAAMQRLQSLQDDEAIKQRAGILAEELAITKPVTVAMLTEGLLRIARDCEASDTATAKNVARSAYMDVAKLNGLVGERNDSGNAHQQITGEPLSEEQWNERYAGE